MFHPQGPTFWELARQALSSTERGYDLLAPKFDYTPYRTPDEVLHPAIEQIGRPGSIDSALDVCCGTGAAMRFLRPLCRERVVGIDFSQGMLDVARENTADSPGAAGLEFVRGNVLDMPFESEFDVAVCFGALGHILPRDEDRFIEQVAKVLKPGGRFVIVSCHMPSVLTYRYWAARSFNAAMHIRNRFISPPFIMYYLTFLLPEVKEKLQRHGFEVTVSAGVYEGQLDAFRVVTAVRA